MGIQINGQTDVISAADGSLTVSGADLTSAINFSVSGVGTITDLRATNANITGVGTIATLIVTGNASIGGTVTYMDVTNVDSVGIITAQVGLQVLANGINVTGVSTLSGGVNASQGVDATGLRVTGITTLGQTNITGLSNAGVSTLGNATASTLVVSGVSTLGAASATLLNVSGVVTATSFSGSGANLTGVAATSNISTNAIVNSGVTTVAAGSAAAPSISPTGDTDTGIFFPSADTIAFGEGGSEAARIDSSGRFGIGTTSPGSLLHLAGNANSAQFDSSTGVYLTFKHNGTAVGYIGSANQVYTGGGTGNVAISGGDGSSIAFATTDIERARIDSSGRLLVGTSTSFSGSLLQIARDQATLGLRGTSSAYAGEINFYGSTESGDGYSWIVAANTGDFYIAGAGFTKYATLTGKTTFTGWTFASDARLKENIVDCEYGIDAIKLIKPRRFNFLNSTDSTVGFIAQELREIIPEAVNGQELPFAENDTPQQRASKTLGVNKDALIPALVKALQEAITKIETLEARLTAAGIE